MLLFPAPAILTPPTLISYSVYGSKSLSVCTSCVAGIVVVVYAADWLACGLYSTRYAVTGLPPSLRGADHTNEMLEDNNTVVDVMFGGDGGTK